MISFIAGILEIVGVWIVGSHDRRGFLIALLGNIVWGYCSFAYQVWGLLLVSVAMAFVNIRNFLAWGRNKSTSEHSCVDSNTK